MATSPPLFTKLISLFLLLLIHLACFICTSNPHKPKDTKKLKLHKHKPWSFLKRIFTSKKTITSQTETQINPNPSLPSPSSSTRSLRQSSDIISLLPPPNPQRKTPTESDPESEISSSQHFFSLRNNIYPCPGCGEIFQTPNLLEQHQSLKHAVSELVDGDSGKNIVRIIFNTGWTGSVKTPTIHRILKVHNSSKILAKFDEYREIVKSKAARNGVARRRDERCIADGNELLRFHCATFLCDLGQNGNSGLCNQQFCSVCGIIKSGFSPKMDGISTLSTSCRAHVAIPDEIEEEFKFMNLKRAMLVCRVIAGRVGCDPEIADKDDSGYDSLMGRVGGMESKMDEEDELLVFNPRAVLPCFIIVYTL